MAVVQKDYKGGCETLNLNGSLSSGALSLPVKTTPSGNWPTGSTLPFVITVDRGNASEELMLCSARAGANFTVTTRGYAGSAAVGHGDNATVEHTVDAIALADMMNAAAQTTGKVTTAEDILVATASGTFKRVAKGADGTFLRVSGGSVGYGVIPDGSISSSTMFASGVVGSTQLAASSVVAGKIATGGVSAAGQIANNIITATQILNNTITAGQVANATLTDTQIASANKDGAAGTAGMRTLGTGASQAASGSDSRLSDTRTPTDGSVTQAKMATGLRAHYAQTSQPTGAAGDTWYDTTNNLLYVYNGSAWVCVTPQGASVATNQTTASSSYTDLATVGPAVTVQTGTKAIVTVGANITNASVGSGAAMSYAVGSPSNLAAADATAAFANVMAAAGSNFTYSMTSYLSTLTAGTNTFTAKYRTPSAGTAGFINRHITVTAIP